MSDLNLNGLCRLILEDNELLRSARKKAGKLVNNNSADMTNCCAATLSYLLIDGLSLNLRPTTRAMKLAYILERELGFQVIQTTEAILPGDVGVVDEPKRAKANFAEQDDDIEDGDAFDVERLGITSNQKYSGEGYVESDPDERNWHHIYLVLEPHPTSDNNKLLIVDNQAASPHLRDIRGGSKSVTKYFLRSPK